MSIYSIKCQDGSDSQCYKNLEIEIPIGNLSAEQVLDITEDGGCEFTSEEAKKCTLTLSKNEKKSLKENGCFYREVNIKGDTICAACGSDYTRNDNGDIIN
jgi:hypothetical protein